MASSAATPSSSVSSPTTDSPRSAGPSQSPVASKTKPSPVYSPPPNVTAGTTSGIRPSAHVSHGGSRSTGLTAPAKKASTHTPGTIQGHGAEKFEFGPWENSTIAYVLGVTLDVCYQVSFPPPHLPLFSLNKINIVIPKNLADPSFSFLATPS